MPNLGALTEEERGRHERYLEQARSVGEPPGMAERRDANTGRSIDPSELLLRPAPANAHAEYVAALDGRAHRAAQRGR